LKLPLLIAPTFEKRDEIELAVTEFNRRQNYFALSVVTANWITDTTEGKWIDQSQLFRELNQRLCDAYACVVVQSPLKWDLFADYKPKSLVISTADWETSFAPPSVSVYILFMLACGLVDLICDLPEDVSDSALHDPPIGCISDYNSDKNSIKATMIDAHVCDHCQRLLTEYGLEKEALDAVNEVLHLVSSQTRVYAKDVFKFVIGQALEADENLYIEYKGKTTGKPEDKIPKEALEYAVAFLNREGGKIFWGIRHPDQVVDGVKLNREKRDLLQQRISGHLHQIVPAISSTDYRLLTHPVRSLDGTPIRDLLVLELSVAPGDPTSLYKSANGKVWVKTPGGTQSLNDDQISSELRKRSSKVPTDFESEPKIHN
jgi:hypothetical protein